MIPDISYTIRKLNDGEIPRAMALVWRVFEKFEAPCYTPQGVQEFKNFIQMPSIQQQKSFHHFQIWGAIINDEIRGVIATRNINHICLLFVEKKFHRQGIAKKLFEALLAEFMESRASIEFITVNSSPYAVDIYRKLGFADTDMEQAVNGIRFTPMKYTV